MKKALSLLLAVLMLVSLFSGMAFADDDVIVEEPADDVIAEEPAATDEFVGDDYVEAADAYVEEYTDEGSFEAADAFTLTDIRYYLAHDYEVDRVTTTDGKYLGDTFEDIPSKHGSEALVWLKEYQDVEDPDTHELVREYGNPEKYYVIVPHNWSAEWTTVIEGEASCETGGMAHKERVCLGDEWDPNCKAVEKSESFYLPMQKHQYVMDETYTMRDGTGDDRAIVKAPTCKAPGKGHWTCQVCGAKAPDVFYIDDMRVEGDYVIRLYKTDGVTPFRPGIDPIEELDPIYHDWGGWTTIKPASCVKPGTEAHYCNICNMQQTRDIEPYNHSYVEPFDAMGFVSTVRVDCEHYVELWTCTIPGCGGGVNGSQYSVYLGPEDPYDPETDVTVLQDNELAKLDVTALDPDDCFFYVTKYENSLNVENYEHHLFGLTWEPNDPPACCVPGTEIRRCTVVGCNGYELRPVAALEPIYDTEVHTAYYEVEAGNPKSRIYYHWVDCTREDCQDDPMDPMEPLFGGPDFDEEDPSTYIQANVLNPNQVMIVDHNWSAWTCYVQPIEGVTKGHWTRTCLYTDTLNAEGVLENCLANEEFVGTQAEFDAMVNPPHPVLTTGIIKDEDGAFKLYEMGVFDEDFTGIYDGYNYVLEKSGKWYVVEGIWENDAMGATLVGETWYFLANGKVQEVSQLAEYQGKWFYVVNGVIDTSKTALVDYNGGKFVVAVGRIVDEYNGLWQNAKSIGGDDSWYYIANGQVQTQYTGLVLYDGEWFYVENGQLVPYNGEVEYDGEIFNVKEGMVVA